MDSDFIVKILAAIGGIATVSGGVAALIGKIVSSRILQSHRHQLDLQLENHRSTLNGLADKQRVILKRQELMFEKEYAAASDFHRILTGILPKPWAPDLDWSDAQTAIADNFQKHAKALKEFLSVHTSAPSLQVRKTLEKAKHVANEGEFEVAQDHRGEGYDWSRLPNREVRKRVDQFYELMQEADERIMQDLKTGSLSDGIDDDAGPRPKA